MDKEIKIKLNEALKVFEVVEKLHDFLHQPMNYQDLDDFATQVYPELKEIYYDVIWEWLPEDIKAKLEER